jgi:hypothetical protein
LELSGSAPDQGEGSGFFAQSFTVIGVWHHPAMVGIIRPMKCRIVTATTALLLAAEPGLGQSTDWRENRDWLLGPGRDILMQYCAIGRKQNANGLLYWDPDYIKNDNARMQAKGYSQNLLDAQNSGRAAAMSQACPEVR